MKNPFNGLIRKLFPVQRQRSFDAGRVTRTTSDWNPGTTTADVEIAAYIQLLRARARDHDRNNDYARRYYGALVNNVLKEDVGFSLQMQVRDASGSPDNYANDTIESAWKQWSKPKNCTVTGLDGLYDVAALALRSAARDGSFLCEIIRDKSLNEFAFALKPLEIDHLDLRYNVVLENGNSVFIGIEKNPNGKVVALWLVDQHPGDTMLSYPYGYTTRRRVPMENIIHYFVRERPTQHLGVPWLCSAMTRLNHLKEYERAELIAARSAAEKGGWFKNTSGEPGGYKGPDDGSGNKIMDSAPGSFEELPQGFDFIPYDPKHPTDAFSPFIKATLRGVAAGGGISYMALTGDLSEANFSSMRAGRLEELEFYKKIQSHMIRHFMLPVFEAWLESAFLSGYFDPLPFSKFDKFNAPKFTGRSWPWIDPKADVEAALMAINGGLTTRTKITEEGGENFEEIISTLQQEKMLADKAGLKFAMPGVGGSGTENAAPQKQKA